MTGRAAKKGRSPTAREIRPFFGPGGVSIRSWQDPGITGGLEMTTHAIGSVQEHLPARLKLLEADKT